MNSTHTREDLLIMQSLPLEVKVRMTQTRIREWVNYWQSWNTFVSFSGGIDSTVLLHIVRDMYPEMPAIFVNTTNEFPEVVEFVNSFDNVTTLTPQIGMAAVIKQYGYPIISKEVAGCVALARKHSAEGVPTEDNPELCRLLGTGKYKRERGYTKGSLGKYSFERWKGLLDAPFAISNKCCDELKKKPVYAYARKTYRNRPILGTLASESILREQAWLRTGCNAFEAKKPHSKPMSFWLKNDVLRYAKENGLQICSLYGDIVEITADVVGGEDGYQQTITFGDIPLKTTGADRLGCIVCGFGCAIEGDDRFLRLRELYPNKYEWCMKPVEQGGLGYREVLQWLNDNTGTHIRYE